MPSIARRAFSLIELLVVVLIIALLLGILIPTIAAVRRSAFLTTCSTQLRQLGAAAIAYRTDHRRWPIVKPWTFDLAPRPALSLMSEDEARLAVAPYLQVALCAYLPVDSPVYRCPGDSEGVIFDRARKLTGFGQSYVEWFPLCGYKERSEPIFKLLFTDFCGMGWANGSIADPKFHAGRFNAVKTDGSVETQFVGTTVTQ
ncbi:MAG: prepilin-type N-terminal cleavage/methylation domain-containing protein [Tepidisphaeraceae bacterium]